MERQKTLGGLGEEKIMRSEALCELCENIRKKLFRSIRIDFTIIASSSHYGIMKAKIIKDSTVIYPKLSYEINGIIFQVHKSLGLFCNEKQYCDAIENLLKKEGIEYDREKILPASFAGEHCGRNKVDFLIENKLILEVKAKNFVTKEDYYQARRYLTAFGAKLAILVNMRRRTVYPKRVLNSEITRDKKDYFA